MSRLAVLLICVLVSLLPAFGQSDKTLQCPSFSVTGPAGIGKLGQPESFTVDIENPDRYKFVWTVSGGRIVSGQGTTKLDAMRGEGEVYLTATVEILGLPAGCLISKGSETAPLIRDQGPALVADVPISASRLPKASLNALIEEIIKSYYGQGYVVLRFSANTPQRVARNYQKKIEAYIATQAHRVDPKRITIIHSPESDASRVKFYVVPPGATPPSQD